MQNREIYSADAALWNEIKIIASKYLKEWKMQAEDVVDNHHFHRI